MKANAEIVTIVGAGLAGTLLSILLAKRPRRVRLYERLPDIRRETIAAGRSINLALAARGIEPLKIAGVMDQVRPLLIPMPGRIVHDLDGRQTFVPYGQRPDEVIYSVSRPELNRVLLNAAEQAGVEMHFCHPATALHIDRNQLLLRDAARGADITLPLQHVIGADGAGSLLRRSFVTALNVPCTEELLEHGYKELTLPSANGQHRLDANALHIWPRGGFMLIALPNIDGTFTATLFLANQGEPGFASLNTAAKVNEFFAHQFPDVHAIAPELAAEFLAHPIGVMGTVHCSQWHINDQLLLIGDAAHGMTPFHGQGMNCAFEDCRELDRLLAQQSDWATAYNDFEISRHGNTDAIATMAIENYLEMRDTVRAPKFQLQKALSLELERRFPDRFIPRYSMVMFHDEIPYALAYTRGQIQANILDELTREATTLDDIDYSLAASSIEQRLASLAGTVSQE